MTSGWRGLPLVCPRCRGRLLEQPTGAACAACGASYDAQDGVLRLVIGSGSSPVFDPHYFASLRDVEERHFWFLGRRRVVLSCLRRCVPDLSRRRLLDVGCGSGGLLAFLAANGVPIAGATDAYHESLRMVSARLPVPLVQVDEGRVPPLGPGYDLISMFDVLEHVDDDVGMLHALRDSLVAGGVLALTVPADPRLFDEMDELAYHRRRYTRQGLASAIEQAGLEVLLLSYFMSPLVPVLRLVRSAGRQLGDATPIERRRVEFRVVPVVNGVMRAVLAAERALIGRVDIPFGSSLVAVARRPDR